jgi:acyl-CoA dehydrogenase
MTPTTATNGPASVHADLTPNNPRLLDDLRTIAREVLTPIAHQGRKGRVNRELLAALGDTGVLGLLFPEGDGPASAATVCLLREAVAYECTEAESLIVMQGLGGYPILQSGQPHQIARWVDPLRKGSAVAAFALTEPGAGSDAGNLALAAEADGDGWRLSGEKLWITNAPDADFYTTFARTTPNVRAKGVSAFVIEGDAPGLTAEHIDLVADHPIGRLIFDGVKVSRADLLGELDRGFRVAMRGFDLFRPSVGSAAIGMGAAALDLAVAHTLRREAFGRPLADKQAVAHALADIATDIEASRLLISEAAHAYDQGDPRTTGKAAMSKVFATEAAQRAIDTAIQFHGAIALRSGHKLEALYREIRATRIFEGASEIQRDLIARDLFNQHSSAIASTDTKEPK